MKMQFINGVTNKYKYIYTYLTSPETDHKFKPENAHNNYEPEN